MSGSKPNIMVASDGQSPFIEQVVGPEKGRQIELAGNKLTIGRTDENDIIVPSDAVSRTHAMLMQSDGAWFIRDNNSKNGIKVNGAPVTESWLSDGDIVQVGSFVFRFREPTAEGQAPTAEPAGALPAMETAYDAVPSAAPKKKPNRRLLIYGVVGLLLVFVLMSNNNGGDNKDKAAGGQDAAQTTTDGAPANSKLARDFEAAKEPNLLDNPKTFDENGKPKGIAGIEDPALKSAEQEMTKLDWTNSSLKEAEQFFRKGQREYLSGNYQRSIDDFSTALSFYRGHKLAEKYLRLAIFEVETAAKKHMTIAIQYFEALQYQRAKYHFEEVVNLMTHRPQEPIVGEAERYISLCKRRLQAAELFP